MAAPATSHQIVAPAPANDLLPAPASEHQLPNGCSTTSTSTKYQLAPTDTALPLHWWTICWEMSLLAAAPAPQHQPPNGCTSTSQHQVTTCTNWYFCTIAGQSVGKCLGESKLKLVIKLSEWITNLIGLLLYFLVLPDNGHLARAYMSPPERDALAWWHNAYGRFLSALIAPRDKTNKTWLITLCVALTYY